MLGAQDQIYRLCISERTRGFVGGDVLLKHQPFKLFLRRSVPVPAASSLRSNSFSPV